MRRANALKRSSKKNSLKTNTASHNDASWCTGTDGFLEHSPSGGSLSYKGSALQKIISVCFGSPLIYKVLYYPKFQASSGGLEIYPPQIRGDTVHDDVTLLYFVILLQTQVKEDSFFIFKEESQSNWVIPESLVIFPPKLCHCLPPPPP